ncbi:hypothetical protein ACFWN1_17970 [Streptomyces sp. NPDC058459]|uniref:hypothetical protein n=1 Tax=Streptomyces sp. NPDC058459 TaxID=3346508 RepID=UPI003668CB95
MATPTVRRIPRDASDELLRKLHIEAAWNVPLTERRTCPEHLNWRDRCTTQHRADAEVVNR